MTGMERREARFNRLLEQLAEVRSEVAQQFGWIPDRTAKIHLAVTLDELEDQIREVGRHQLRVGLKDDDVLRPQSGRGPK